MDLLNQNDYRDVRIAALEALAASRPCEETTEVEDKEEESNSFWSIKKEDDNSKLQIEDAETYREDLWSMVGDSREDSRIRISAFQALLTCYNRDDPQSFFIRVRQLLQSPIENQG